MDPAAWPVLPTPIGIDSEREVNGFTILARLLLRKAAPTTDVPLLIAGRVDARGVLLRCTKYVRNADWIAIAARVCSLVFLEDAGPLCGWLCSFCSSTSAGTPAWRAGGVRAAELTGAELIAGDACGEGDIGDTVDGELAVIRVLEGGVAAIDTCSTHTHSPPALEAVTRNDLEGHGCTGVPYTMPVCVCKRRPEGSGGFTWYSRTAPPTLRGRTTLIGLPHMPLTADGYDVLGWGGCTRTETGALADPCILLAVTTSSTWHSSSAVPPTAPVCGLRFTPRGSDGEAGERRKWSASPPLLVGNTGLRTPPKADSRPDGYAIMGGALGPISVPLSSAGATPAPPRPSELVDACVVPDMARCTRTRTRSAHFTTWQNDHLQSAALCSFPGQP